MEPPSARPVFGVHKNRDIQSPAIFKGPSHEIGIFHGQPIIGNNPDAGLFHIMDFGKGFAFQSLGESTGLTMGGQETLPR